MTTKLTLCAPLFYAREDAEPFCATEAGGERLFCFEIAQARNIEPDESGYLAAYVAGGKAFTEDTVPDTGLLELPAGVYLFAQCRANLNEADCTRLAIEIQKDGLWEQFALESHLFIRRLFEDGASVTQIFRPLIGRPVS
jgi:hypothetical protein